MLSGAPGLQLFGGPQWTPLRLSPYAGWDGFMRPDLITSSGGLVSSWRDIVSGYDAVQATGAAQPTRTGAWVYGDGVDDELTLTPVPAGLPIGATPCELWFRVDQQSLAADTTVRVIGGYGGATASIARRLIRQVVTGTNRARGSDSGSNLDNTAVDFSGKHTVRMIATGTTIDIEVGGVSAGGTAQVSAITSTRLRFFCAGALSPSNFALCGIAAHWIVPPLTTAQAAQMYVYMNKIV